MKEKEIQEYLEKSMSSSNQAIKDIAKELYDKFCKDGLTVFTDITSSNRCKMEWISTLLEKLLGVVHVKTVNIDTLHYRELSTILEYNDIRKLIDIMYLMKVEDFSFNNNSLFSGDKQQNLKINYNCNKQASPLQYLSLIGNQLGPDALRFLSPSMYIHPNLLELDLSLNKLGVNGAKILAEILKNTPELQNLLLYSCNIGIGVQSIAEVIKKKNLKIEYLNFNNNKIDAKGMEYVVEMLPCLKKLELLNIGNNIMGNQVYPFVSALLTTATARFLKLNNMGMNDYDAKYLVQFLEVNNGLHIICVDGNKFSKQTFINMKEALKNNAVIHYVKEHEKAEISTNVTFEITNRNNEFYDKIVVELYNAYLTQKWSNENWPYELANFYIRCDKGLIKNKLSEYYESNDINKDINCEFDASEFIKTADLQIDKIVNNYTDLLIVGFISDVTNQIIQKNILLLLSEYFEMEIDPDSLVNYFAKQEENKMLALEEQKQNKEKEQSSDEQQPSDLQNKKPDDVVKKIDDVIDDLGSPDDDDKTVKVVGANENDIVSVNDDNIE